MATLAFDVYGTLIDTHNVVCSLEKFLGAEHASNFSKRWRDKQLEYSFRLGLMRRYKDFNFCTKAALEFTANEFEHRYNCVLSATQKDHLSAQYAKLPAFDDVLPALLRLREEQHRCFAFSNGSQLAVENLLNRAGLGEFFEGIISCEEIESYKPNPDVYQHFVAKTNSNLNDTWLISSNSFDIIGATATGWKTAWLKRTTDMQLDPWNMQPTKVLQSLAQLSL